MLAYTTSLLSPQPLLIIKPLPQAHPSLPSRQSKYPESISQLCSSVPRRTQKGCWDLYSGSFYYARVGTVVSQWEWPDLILIHGPRLSREAGPSVLNKQYMS